MGRTQLTILQKNGMFSFLGYINAHQLKLDAMSESEFQKMIAVVKLDPREGQPMLKQFDTSSEALTSYEGAIHTSVERGWEVVFRGLPMYG